MKGLSSNAKERIGSIIENMFDDLAVHLVGNLPKYKDRKNLFLGDISNNLAHLFIQSMSNQMPNQIERDLLKSLLESASGYIDALKSRTKSNVAEKLDAMAREANMKNIQLSEQTIREAIAEEMSKSRSHLLKIAEAESSKIRTIGTAVNITHAAQAIGESDPSIYFQVLKDGATCKWCIQNHLMPDGITPRVFKLSEVKHGYLSAAERKNGDVSLSLQHPHCRCALSYVTKGFGFKNGRIDFIGLDHNEYEYQRK